MVADEVRRLAERATKATKEIAQIITTVQKGTSEAVLAMGEAAGEVEAGSKLSAEAGQALRQILEAVEETASQTADISRVVAEMTQLSAEVVNAIDSVSAVVEENTAATQQMAAGATDVSRAIEGAAAISEENAASVEEVSAGAEEMSAQVEEMVASAEELSRMADDLREAVSPLQVGGRGVRGGRPGPEAQVGLGQVGAQGKWLQRPKELQGAGAYGRGLGYRGSSLIAGAVREHAGTAPAYRCGVPPGTYSRFFNNSGAGPSAPCTPGVVWAQASCLRPPIPQA